jgi:DNA-binding NtrC family response regulator
MRTREGELEILILAIDDSQAILELYKNVMGGRGVRVEVSAEAEGGLAQVFALSPDLVLLDLAMPGLNGLEVLRRIKQWNSQTRVVMITGHYSIETAVEAIREGAADYICKPVMPEKLRELVAQARRIAERRQRAEALDKELAEVFSFHGIVGRSPLMQDVFDMIQRIAPHFRSALVMGETGTGKELVARALHDLSPRKDKHFAVCNCAAMVESLAESQLFGHRKGAFTGADEDRAGIFEWADGGTVFLDEVGDLSPQVQSKLLRVLENREIQKVGSPQTRTVDTLVISATSRNLTEEIKNGRFRADLWYRLSMLQTILPPLRDRKEDIPLLCHHFIAEANGQYSKQIKGLSPAAEKVLMRYSWPGNVRELSNVIRRACILARDDMIDFDDLRTLAPEPQEAAGAESGSLEQAEKAAVVRVLNETRNKALAARMLGVSRATLYRLIEKYGLQSLDHPDGNGGRQDT